MKKLNMLLMIPFYLMACNATPGQDATSQKAKDEAWVKQYFQHFNNHDWSKLADMYKDTALFRDPSLGNDIVTQNKTQIMDKYRELHLFFPDIKDSVTQIYSAGPHNIVVEFISIGTGQDNTRFHLPICTIFTIENGKISKDFTYYNNAVSGDK